MTTTNCEECGTLTECRAISTLSHGDRWLCSQCEPEFSTLTGQHADREEPPMYKITDFEGRDLIRYHDGGRQFYTWHDPDKELIDYPGAARVVEFGLEAEASDWAKRHAREYSLDIRFTGLRSASIVPIDKPQRGRPAKHGRPMTAAERKAAERERVRTLADRRYYEQWDERVCLHVLGTGKYSDTDQRKAWERLGQLREWR